MGDLLVVSRTGILQGAFAVALLLLCIAMLPLLASHPAAVQDAPDAPRVEITQSAGPPGGSVAVPIRLLGTEGDGVGAVKITVRFPAKNLTFTKVEMGGLGEAVAAEATATSRQDGEDVVLVVGIATPDAGGERAPLPDGPIAQILFTVAKDLKPQTVIPMRVHAAGTSAQRDARPVALAAKDAEVIVSNPTVISCFFYMH